LPRAELVLGGPGERQKQKAKTDCHGAELVFGGPGGIAPGDGRKQKILLRLLVDV